MKHTDASGCLSIALLRFVRDHSPTVARLVDWLGPTEAGRFHLLRKAGLLCEEAGRVSLSPRHLSADGTRFVYGNSVYLVDEDRIVTVKTTPRGAPGTGCSGAGGT
jgi:hypothetical protein